MSQQGALGKLFSKGALFLHVQLVYVLYSEETKLQDLFLN